jgi:hypothetical protein
MGLAGGMYYYVISAVNSAGESGASVENSATALIVLSQAGAATANRNNGAETAANAFDGKTSTKWFTGGGYSAGWLQADLGAGNEAVVTLYDLTSANDASNRDPKNWQLLGSNDGTNWTTLDSRTGEAFASRFLTKQYTAANGTAYRYYRLNILSNFSGSTTDGIQLAELALYGYRSAPVTIPSAPTGLGATAVSTNRIDLSWTASSGATSYNVKRSSASGGPYTTVATGVTSTSYGDASIPTLGAYYYVVTAISATGESAASNEAVATPLTPVEQWRMAHFGSSEAGDEAVDLADPDGDGHPNLLEYALGGDPLVSDAAGRSVAGLDESGRLTLAFDRVADPALLYEAQASDDLATWATFWSSTGAGNTTGPVTVADLEPLGASPRRFLRISVRWSE